MKTRLLRILVTLLLSYSFQANAKGKYETNDFHILLKKAQETAETCSPSKIAVVVDIDNTLLSMNQPLGGDAWFNWQADLIAKNDLTDAVATNLNELLNVQGLLFSISSMHPADLQNPQIIQTLQKLGFPLFALTSRGLEFQNATLRELKKNGYDFTNSSPGPQFGFAGNYLPYDLTDLSYSGISQEEVDRWKLAAAKPVLFQNGIFFGAGQHKGAMLKSILAKSHFKPCGIVFIDDTAKNTERVWDAYASTSVDISVIRYGFLDDEVTQFTNSDKSQVKQQWISLQTVLNSIFVK